MKLNDSTRFPHPVLWESTGDFLDGAFLAGNVQVEEDLSAGQVTLKVGFDITHPDVRKLIAVGEASAGLIVECAETYFSRVISLEIQGGTARLDSGTVSGRVVVRPAVWVAQALPGYRPAALHPEFADHDFMMGRGALIAVTEEQTINVGREKLAPIETIFDLCVKEDVPEQEFRVDLETQRIAICVGKRTHDDISGMRNSRQGKSVLLSAVYLPVLMTVLEAIQDGDSSYEGKRWHTVLVAKTSSMGIDLKGTDPLISAQQLLKAPFGRTAAIFHEGHK